MTRSYALRGNATSDAPRLVYWHPFDASVWDLEVCDFKTLVTRSVKRVRSHAERRNE